MTLCMVSSVAAICYVALALIGVIILVPAFRAMQRIRIFEKSLSVVIVVCFCQFCLVGLLYLAPDGLLSSNPSRVSDDAFVIMVLTYTACGFSLLSVMLLRFIVWLFRSSKKLVRMGDDPVTMLAPYYDGTWFDIDRVLAQAICMKALRSRYGEYVFKVDGVEAALGVDLNAMRECLKSNLPLAMRIHMEFSRMLAIRQDEFLDEIMRLQSCQRGWGVLGLPKGAMKDTYEIAYLLLPYVKRSNIAGK